jgi:hypothetical protein
VVLLDEQVSPTDVRSRVVAGLALATMLWSVMLLAGVEYPDDVEEADPPHSDAIDV